MDMIQQEHKLSLMDGSSSDMAEDDSLKLQKSSRLHRFLTNQKTSLLVLVANYSVVGLITAGLLHFLDPIGNTLTRGLVIAILVCLILMICNLAMPKSSMFGPFWTLLTLGLSWLYFLDTKHGQKPEGVLAIIAITIHAVANLTSFLKKWKGLTHEAFIYDITKDLLGGNLTIYIPAYIFLLHLLPTLVVYTALLPIHYIFYSPGMEHKAFSLLSSFGFLTMLFGTGYQAIANEQLRKWRIANGNVAILMDGLWQYSRHPDYFGECIFWFGSWIMCLGVNPSRWWTIIGPILLIVMFYFFIAHILEIYVKRKSSEYYDYQNMTSKFIPWRRRIGPLLERRSLSG